MKRYSLLFFTLILALLPLSGQAQSSDSVDVLDYDIALDLSHGSPCTGDATVTLCLLRGCDSIGLELLGTVDSLWVNTSAVANPRLTAIPTGGIAAGDTFTVRVCYRASGYVEAYGFGGLHLDNGLTYNLGVGFDTDPHPIGRAIMPCRDNFHDKATYTLRVHTKPGWSAECSGLLVSREVQDDNTERSVWRVGHPASTYLVGISQTRWNRYQRDIVSQDGTYPLTVGYRTQSSTSIARAFAELDSVVPMFERCFGPYRWGRIGYVLTPLGSMEHVTNIALAEQAANPTSDMGQSTIAHELGHAWFGNLITCGREGDMWINEGGASFCSEVAKESTSGRVESDKYYQKNLEEVIRTTHLKDGGLYALSGMPHDITYGSTTYDKGWMVWHSLRGYLGDSLFYACVRRLMESKAFDTVDAYGVRDSMSLYSGVDLTDFFDFHVFSPGFVDYKVDLLSHDHPAVRIRQQGVGTTTLPRSGRVPVTFFGTDGTTMKTWFPMNGDEGGGTLDVAYPVAYCVLDYDREISDAATLDEVNMNGAEIRTAVDAHMRILRTATQPSGLPHIHVEHHWGRPWGADTTEGVRRTANRYWVVASQQPHFPGLQGQFRFVRDDYIIGNYPNLDPGLLPQPASIDSLALLYREDADHPWVALSRRRTGDNEDYLLTDNLRMGEYTLAIIDTALMGIAAPKTHDDGCLMIPNPVTRGEAFSLQVPTDAPFTVRIFNTAGRRVWQKQGCRNGEKIKPRLACGTYLVQIENKFVSLQSKLIVL